LLVAALGCGTAGGSGTARNVQSAPATPAAPGVRAKGDDGSRSAAPQSVDPAPAAPAVGVPVARH
jgi:hypothetical protein